ncbi:MULTISPECIES: folylpolyglutamate synthase/dihydrofolate synthase family protein [unclassified Paenibacillus]|uniref:bifunctional folylpolyglutamate synthase/dihydrofolate synthase n=1 Tax=unclassified Paenibacillus TaxID=185978 RepID=UPI001E4F877F|nr:MULTISPECIES: folylpolyglutamate synthase/dihydrofolate synthase family protein [unclassified Paenibacillus]CAH0119140.1 Folylpolyglutamate synthase [Paenibacillus sp. CECT 9249]
MADINGAVAAAPFQTYEEAVRWINGLIPFGIRPGLARIEMLMDLMGNPHRRLKFIHVAGTNGKGSTCAFLTRILCQSGYDVGTFTSPYIEKFTNRFQYNGQDIPEETLLRLTNELKPYVDEVAATELGSPTMFEVSTALAVLYFAKATFPDYVVWETGLGGRLDVTNIVVPVISVITNIGHDHMDVLGDTIEEIAAEKAGIIKAGVPVVSSAEQPEAIRVLRETAQSRKSTLYLAEEQYRFETIRSQENEQVFTFVGPFRKLDHVVIRMNGEHQIKNAAAALMAIEVLRQYYALIVEDDDLYKALAETAWAGRLEMLGTRPRLLVDGAHNPEGAETLAKALQSTYRYNKLHLMLGMLSTKNHIDVLRHILPIVDTLIITEPDFRKKMKAEDLLAIVRNVADEISRPDLNVTVEPDWKEALRKLTEITSDEDLAVVTGTLYLIADVRSHILYQTDSEKGW